MMKSFNILWFEDNLENFSEIIKNLESRIAKLNRKLVYDAHDHCPHDFDVKLFEGKHSIAFIDLNLNNGQKGVDIIKILRDNGTFMDVLLYSNNPLELEKLTEGANYIEGVFRHATMTGIEDKMYSVIEQINYKEIMVINRYESL